MFTPLFFVGLVALFGGLFGSRFLVERANKFLSSEEKLMLMDSFSSIRTFGALPLVPVVFFFLGMGYLAPEWSWPAYFIGCICLLARVLCNHSHGYFVEAASTWHQRTVPSRLQPSALGFVFRFSPVLCS